MGKQSSVFLALTILTTIAAGIGFFLFYQKQQEAVQIYEKSQRLTSRLEEVDEKLKKTEDALKDAQMKLQQSSRTLQAPTDQDKITALEEELQRTTDALHALQAQQPLDTGTNDETKAFQDTIADQQQQIDGLRMKIEEQEQKITAVSAENTELKAQAAATALPTPTAERPVATPTASDDHQAEREALVASVQDKESKIEDLMRQLTQNQTRLSELETRLAEKQATPGQPPSETPVASDQANPSNHDQVKLLETLQAELAALSEKMGEQERMTQEHVAMLQQQHQADQEQLTALQQQHQKDLEQLTTLQQQHQELQGQLATLQQQHQEDQKQLATLQQQSQQSQEQFAVLQQENQHNQEQLAVLKQQNQEQLATLQTAKEKALSLQADLQTQEEEYRKLKEAHDLSLANLQAEIANGTLEKETIQTRLSEELERSNKEYQERLDNLAKKKEDEIQQLKSVAETYQNLTHDLEKQIEDKTVRIEQIQQKLRVVIVDQILFASGSAQISNDGLKVLKTIGDELKLNLDGRQIGIEGHTDNKVISKRLQSRYATNWELSSARATNVLRYLQDTLEIPGSQLFAVGYGSHRPVADNSTEEGRRLNRRIEIVLTPQLERSKIEE